MRRQLSRYSVVLGLVLALSAPAQAEWDIREFGLGRAFEQWFYKVANDVPEQLTASLPVLLRRALGENIAAFGEERQYASIWPRRPAAGGASEFCADNNAIDAAVTIWACADFEEGNSTCDGTNNEDLFGSTGCNATEGQPSDSSSGSATSSYGYRGNSTDGANTTYDNAVPDNASGAPGCIAFQSYFSSTGGGCPGNGVDWARIGTTNAVNTVVFEGDDTTQFEIQVETIGVEGDQNCVTDGWQQHEIYYRYNAGTIVDDYYVNDTLSSPSITRNIGISDNWVGFRSDIIGTGGATDNYIHFSGACTAVSWDASS